MSGGADRWSTLFFRNRHLLVFTVAGILAAGAASLSSLPRLEDPRLMNRNPVITTLVPGASAERVEALVTEPIERALKEIDSIKTVESTSRAGISVVAVELKDRVTDNQQEFSRMRSALADAERRLPPEAGRPVFDDQRGAVAFTLVAGVTWRGEGPAAAGLMGRLAEELADRLRAVPGTELVRIYGEPEEEITVTPDAEALDALGLDAAGLAAALAGADSRSPAGVMHGASADLRIEVDGALDSVSRIAGVPVGAGRDGGVVRVGDVATVARGERTPPAGLGLTDGHRTVWVAARADPRVRVDRWRGPAGEVVAAFAGELGGALSLDVVFDQTGYTKARLGELGGNLVAGALVIVGVVVVLMGWRAALAVGSTLPLAAGLILFGLAAGGGALHQISIFGMIVALGLLIDNAIVVVDEVHARMRAGGAARDAVAGAVRHLALPLSASTLTTVVAFLPIMLLPGNVGEFVGSIGTSVILALMASWLLALTLTPALAAVWAGDPARATRWWQRGVRSERWARGWRAWLGRGLARPGWLASLACVPPVVGMVLATQLGSQFFPLVDRNMFGLRLWMPPETAIARTAEVAGAVEAAVREQEEITGVHWMVGGSFPSVYYNEVMNQEQAPHFAQAVLVAESSRAVRGLVPALQRTLDERFPQAQVVVRSFAQGPPVEAEVAFRLHGPSVEALREGGERLRAIMAAHPDVLHTRMTLERGEAHLRFVPDEDEARLVGLGLDEVARQVAATVRGATGGSVQEDLTALPVRVRGSGERRDRPDALGDLMVRGAGGGVPLSALGWFALAPSDGAITRRDGRRVNEVQGYIRKGALPIEVGRDVEARLAVSREGLPPGVTVQVGGEAEQEQQAVGQLGLYLPLLLVVMAGTVVLSFRSVRIALVLGAVAGLSVGLGLLATWASGFPVSFNTLLGIAGLIGLALNDSIVVIAALQANPAARAGDAVAIVEEVTGCLRHVIGTTLTTVGGFLPLLLVVGGDFWPPLAVVLAGGVVGSTLLAVLFVPAVYRVFCVEQAAG